MLMGKNDHWEMVCTEVICLSDKLVFFLFFLYFLLQVLAVDLKDSLSSKSVVDGLYFVSAHVFLLTH